MQHHSLVRRRGLGALSLVAAAALMLAGCGSGEEEPGSTDGGTAGATEAAVDIDGIAKDDAAAALLPADIASKGKLIVGADPTYPPNEFIAEDGTTMIGMDVDLGTAIGKKLGLDVEFQTADFGSILPALGSKYDLGMSSYTDNSEREQTVDFVTYYDAGTAWAVKKGNEIDPDNACGKKVAVQSDTTQEADIDAKNTACTDAGKDEIEIQSFNSQGDVTTAVTSGKADAMLADLPVILDAIDKTEGALEQAGDMYDAAPYGIAIAKTGGTLKDAVLAAVKSLIADGTYDDILKQWNAESGAITEPVINGATD